MATALKKNNHVDYRGMAVLATDMDLTGDLTVGDDATVTGTLAAGDITVGGTAVTATAAELNKLDDSLATNKMAPAAGITSDAEAYASSILRTGDLIVTRIVIDLTDLVGSAVDLDIIGKDGVASHIGQVTAAKNGTIIAGSVTCLEVPTGGADDLDFYSATVSTGAEDVDITTLTEQALVTSGAAWASGDKKGMTLLPAADEYLYIVNGEGSAGGTFTAGKFLIELYGLGA